MGALMRAHDWASTPMGPPQAWPSTLKTTIRLMLTSKHPMFIWWGEDLVQFYNDAYRDTMGPERHPSALGQAGRECWAEAWDVIGPDIENVMAGGDAPWYEDRLVPLTRFGVRQDVWWTYGYSPIEDESGIHGVLVICNDVTEDHVLRARLEQTNHALIETMDDGFCLIDMVLDETGRAVDYLFVEANKAFAGQTGLADSVGKTARQLVPDIEQRWIDIYDDVGRTGVARRFVEESPVMGRWFNVYACRIDHPTRRRVALLFTDITDRKNAERALRESEMQARAAAAELQQANLRKDEFLAMLAHELRNPLAPISTAAQILKLPGTDPKRSAHASEVIARQVRHMVELVDDLLDVSRVNRGLVELERRPVDLKSVVLHAIEQARPLIEQRGHTLATSLGAANVSVTGDRKRLVQVMANLLGNAAKYTPDGGHITVGAVRSGNDIQLSVRDDGIGIEAALLPHVFELFTQAKRTPDRAQGGLGLGLALVRSMVTLHGGRVEAESAGLGMGSRFSVILPVDAAGAPAPAAGASALPAARTLLRILIVDDNRDAAESLGIVLAGAGHTVIVEDRPAAALGRVYDAPVDVCLLDIGLPGMDGRELAQRLRAIPPLAQATMIALSGYGQPQDLEDSRRAGFTRHLVKPVDIAQLLDVLENVGAAARAEAGAG